MSRTLKLTFAALAVMLLGLVFFVLDTIQASAAEAVTLDITYGNITINRNGCSGYTTKDDQVIDHIADEYIITGMTDQYKVIIENGSHTVIISDLNIDLSGYDYSQDYRPIDFDKADDCIIKIEGKNVIRANGDCPAIHVPDRNKLTIEETEKTGILYAYGGEAWPGIGRMDNLNIEINSGTIYAYGGENASGIGSSWGHDCGTIVINGGKITAQGGENGAGIGGGLDADGGDITITGGEITATGGDGAAGIGGGDWGRGENITITGGKVTATGGEGASGIGGGFYGGGGNITISDDADVTATGGENGAGIGGGCYGSGGNVTITDDADVKAEGGKNGAGIGGGSRGSGGNIDISGDANVTATGGENGAGIGGGNGGNSGKIDISGGDITATGSEGGAGIGGGSSIVEIFDYPPHFPEEGHDVFISGGTAEDINISGGNITATGGENGGAGIGGGKGGSSEDIDISGGTVKATGGDGAAGIGGGEGIIYEDRDGNECVAGGNSGNIEITDGNITASGGTNGAGIGGGANGNGEDITVSGGNVTVQGGYGSTGIGGGKGGSNGNLDITEDAVTEIPPVDPTRPSETVTTPSETEPTENEPPAEDTTTQGGDSPSGGESAAGSAAAVSSTQLLLAEIADAEEGDTIAFELKGSTIIDRSVFDAISGRDINIIFKLSNGSYWSVNGKDIEKSRTINLGVTLNTRFASADELNELAGDKKTVKFSLAHSGDLGFTGLLNIPVSNSYNGQYANLYYYGKNGFEFVNSSEITDGYAEFVFSHASDYVIVIDDHAYGDDVSSAAGMYLVGQIIEDAVPVVGFVIPIAVSLTMILRKKRSDN